jgi:hypothetical protein
MFGYTQLGVLLVTIEHFEQRQVSVVGHSYVIQLQVTL